MKPICKNCEFYRPIKGFCRDPWYEDAGGCENPEVYDDCNHVNTMVRAGGSEGDGDYFHVCGYFGCVKFVAKSGEPAEGK